MKLLDSSLDNLDRFQKSRRLPGFTWAVIKKYSDDQAGHQAALLTYYGFLALFPLLLVLTTLTVIVAPHHYQLQQNIINGTTNYFPILGQQLATHIHSLHRSGWALIGGLVFTLYGARGAAEIFNQTVNKLWGSATRRDNFFTRSFKNLTIILTSGVGLVLASSSTGLAASAGHGLLFKLLSLSINFVALFGLFQLLLNICLPKDVRFRQTLFGALSVSIGLVVLQTVGGFLLKHELKNLDALYSYFALSLGLLFWIYLQAQVLCYGLEVATVGAHHLWPRSLKE